MKYQVGDIVVFKEDWLGHYSSGNVLYPKGSRWVIDGVHSFTGSEPLTASFRSLDGLGNLFVFDIIWGRVVTLEEWRDIQLNKII